MRRWPRPEARPARAVTASATSSSAAAGGASRMLGGDGSSLLATSSQNTLRTCRIVHTTVAWTSSITGDTERVHVRPEAHLCPGGGEPWGGARPRAQRSVH
eukprot:COSAG04_NODE_4813_length_1883_cov_1.680493_2_plen_101_part_00